MTHAESLAVAQVEPEGYELTRAGRRFYVAYNGTGPTGIAPVVALPTTAAQWAIWNADPSKSYVVTYLGAFLSAGTPGAGGILLLSCLFKAPAQVGANATGLVVANANGGAIASKAIIKSAVVITDPAAGLWRPTAFQSTEKVTAFPGTNSVIPEWDIKGRLIIQPQSGLALSLMGPTGTGALYLPMAEWTELESDVE